ncbi:MAG: NAD(P)H-dependent oxidoreductase, partial [Cyanobacteria bacterium]|nr:NAD(P)H-dependent oxidoreductase [Cyanobacteriota bacterium]
DGFVVGTPEYHGGYSGALKNFLDLQCGHSFKDKWVALVGAAGGRLGADQSLNQLRVVFKNLDAFTWKNQTSAGGSDVNKQGEITNEGVSKRLKAMGEELAGFLKRLKQAQES